MPKIGEFSVFMTFKFLLSLFTYLYQSTCLSIYLSVCLSVCLSVSICLSVCLCVHLSNCLSVCQAFCQLLSICALMLFVDVYLLLVFPLLQITFCGNWILSSQLPINLQFKLETVLSPSSVFKPTDRDISGDLMGLFPTHTTLPSCLAPDGRFAAVYFAGVKVEDGETWSQPMPLALSKDKWAKPHLLIEVSACR